VVRNTASGCPTIDDRDASQGVAPPISGLLTVTVHFRHAPPLAFQNVTALVSGGWILQLIGAHGTAYLVIETFSELALAEQP
jgi:hypothetical protein